MAGLAWTCIVHHLLKGEKPARGGFCNWLRCVFALGLLTAPALSAQAMGSSTSETRPVGPPQRLAQAQPAKIPKVFHGVGVVTDVEADTGALTVNHENIPGFMDAMEMMYAVTPPSLSQGVHPGDKIEFDVDGQTYKILELKNLGRPK